MPRAIAEIGRLQSLYFVFMRFFMTKAHFFITAVARHSQQKLVSRDREAIRGSLSYSMSGVLNFPA